MPGAVAQTGMPSVTRADRVRERELFRYYRPPNPLDHDNQIPLPQPASAERPATSPDVFLTALAQLVTLRLDVKRCIIRYLPPFSYLCLPSLMYSLEASSIEIRPMSSRSRLGHFLLPTQLVQKARVMACSWAAVPSTGYSQCAR